MSKHGPGRAMGFVFRVVALWSVASAGAVAGMVQTIDFPPPGNRLLGDGPFPLEAVASSGLAVQFGSKTPLVCSVTGNTLVPLVAGTCTVAANQPGNDVYDAAPEVLRSFEVRTLGTGPAPVGLTVVRVGEMLHLKWRPEAGATGYEARCDGDATFEGTAPPITVATNEAWARAPERQRAYRCEVRAISGSEITALSRPAYSLAYAAREMGYLASMAVGDFDGNGLPELFGSLAGPAGLAAVPEADLGLASLRSPGRAYRDLRIADLDGDGIDDLVANVYSPLSQIESYSRLYWGQRNGPFVEDEAFASRRIRGYGETIVVADFNNDGRLDIFIPFYTDLDPAEQNVLLVNQGNRQFLEQADALGVANRAWPSGLRVEGAQAVDFDGDGWIDIYTGSRLYKNNGGAFTDVREAMGLPLQFDEGAKFVDWNRDGKLDLVLQIVVPDGNRVLRLFEFDGTRFVERSDLVEDVPDVATRYGFFAADLDADGAEDLIVAGESTHDFGAPPVVFLNRGDSFATSTFLPPGYRHSGSTLVVASPMRHGAVNDIFIVNFPITHLVSLLPDRPFVRVEVLDASGRRNQHGRVVTMVDPDPRLGRVAKAVDGGSGYMSQSEYPVSFAIPEGVASVQVEVRFKSGVVVAQAPAGRTISIYEDGRTVVHEPPTPLTVVPGGSGAGTVTSDLQGIRCGTTCYAAFDRGTVVTLTAVADSGSTFAGWSGACLHSQANCSVALEAAMTVGATFNARVAPNVALAASANPSTIGQAVTFTATLSGTPSPTGTVSFRDGAVTISGCAAAPIATAQAVCTTSALSLGVHTIVAEYGGDANYAGARSNVLAHSVQLVPQAIAFEALASRVLGDPPFAVTATASSGLAVTFTSLSQSVCSVTGNLVTLLAAGTCTVAADQAGDAVYAPAPQVARSFAVKGTPGVSLGAYPSPSALYHVVTFMAVVTGTPPPTGVVVFKDGGAVVPSCAAVPLVAGQAVCSLSAQALGPHAITAEYLGDGLYFPAFAEVSHLVEPLSQSIVFDPLPNRNLGDPPFVLSAAASSGLPVSFTSLTPPVCTVSGAMLTMVSYGTCTVAADQAGASPYAAALRVTRSFSVISLAIPRLVNLSTRARVQTGDDVLIGGFVVGGSASKTVLVRARGPSLAPFGIANPLANPELRLMDSEHRVIATNDDWQAASNSLAISWSGFAPAVSLESAILISLAPGAYTAIVSGAGGTTGTGIVEVFEMAQADVPLVNISTRGQVLNGDEVMIGGFVIQGGAPQTVVVRARGPSLVPFGITNALADPRLRLVRSSDQSTIAENDDWGAAANVAQISASGYAPSNSLESAILVTLEPGAYTAIVSGVGGNGVGIVEVFAP